MKNLKIFILEDDITFGTLLEHRLSMNPNYEVSWFKTCKDLLQNLHHNPDLITLDYALPDGNGAEMLEKIKNYNAEIPVIILSGQQDIQTAVALIKDGATDYLIKNKEVFDKIWFALISLQEKMQLRRELEQLRRELKQKYQFERVIKGQSPPIQHLFELMRKATRTNITISITGETGTGKELVAKTIHYNSPQSEKPFVAVNMAAIPKELIESELFGHEKGSFTGAYSRRIGKFEEAENGTIFLDEIAELDMNLQAKLLRALQEREIVRVGGNKIIKISARVIVATHKDLAEEVSKGNFRKDLYYRLLGFPIKVPPLRERGGDILILARFFLDEFCKTNRMPRLEISPEAQTKLLQYAYPGNVRELKAICDLAAVMASGSIIRASDISFTNMAIDFALEQELTLKEYEKIIIRKYLDKYNQNILLVAQKLDIGKSTIYRMLKNNEI